MRIGIDGHALGTGAGGNETYMCDLLGALYRHEPRPDVTAIVSPPLSESVRQAACFPAHVLAHSSSALRVPFLLPAAASRLKLDLLHVQYIAPPWCPCAFVVSVHDIVWTRYPESLPPLMRLRLSALVPHTLSRARRILVLTNAMRDAIADEYRLPPDRFDVVQPYPDPRFRPVTDCGQLEAVRNKYGLPSRYIAYVGALQPRKNLVRLCTAFQRVSQEFEDTSLVIVGKRAWLYRDLEESIEALRLGDRLTFTGYVERADLPAILSGAAVFAYVSLYEGFGIPVLEAMACGTPCLISNDPALTEVAGGAAHTCNPHSTEDIEAGLGRLLGDERERARLSALGAARAQSFTASAMAARALGAYAQALGG